jgi:ferredoxin
MTYVLYACLGDINRTKEEVSDMSVTVKFVEKVKMKDGKSILKAAEEADIRLKTSCGGRGKCGKCVVKIIAGKVSEPAKEEIKELGQDKIDKGYRLACMTNLESDDVTVEVVRK